MDNGHHDLLAADGALATHLTYDLARPPVCRRLGQDLVRQHVLELLGHHPPPSRHRRTGYQELDQLGRVVSPMENRLSRLPDRQGHTQLKGKRGSRITLGSTDACPGSSLTIPLGFFLLPSLTIVHTHLGIIAPGCAAWVDSWSGH